jgi:HD-GYP domain-containing protein (c-di-GMP phosphodiesterase class II)
MLNDKIINLGNLLLSLSDAVDLASNLISSHQQRTAYIAWQICRASDLPEETVKDVFIAGILHDIGAISVDERISMQNLEEIDYDGHCLRGELLLKRYHFFRKTSRIVRDHHKRWFEYEGEPETDITMSSQIIKIADYVERLIDRNMFVLRQKKAVIEKINSMSGTEFNPFLVERFNIISKIESFWLDVTSPRLYSQLFHDGPLKNIEICFTDLETISKLFRDIIDFKSPYTAAHTAGVSSTAGIIAHIFGLADSDILQLKIAGNFHDLGKLAIPNSILDKPEKLTHEEFDIIKCHTYYSYHIINSIKGLEEIAKWGAFHHERLNGKGYPFRIGEKDLSTYSRIIMVADIFTALTENRPYREGMKKKEIICILKDLSEKRHLDMKLAGLVTENFDQISDYVVNIENLIMEFYKSRFANLSHETFEALEPDY